MTFIMKLAIMIEIIVSTQMAISVIKSRIKSRKGHICGLFCLHFKLFHTSSPQKTLYTIVEDDHEIRPSQCDEGDYLSCFVRSNSS